MIFVDTWAWLALAVNRDQHHEPAMRQHQQLQHDGRRYVTSDWVLGELITNLYRMSDADKAARFVGSVLQAIRRNQYRLVPVTPDQFDQAWTLRQKYHDKPDISFTDLTSMVIMRELGISDVFTGDRHFEHVGLGFSLLPTPSV